MSSPSPSPKHCFNSKCNRILLCTKRGWRRRTGDFADLCDTCAAAYEEGKFCELFHTNDSGWRGCQSCGKQIHCGCIVSFRMLVLLDAGGIECIDCRPKTFVLTPNPAWLPPSHVLHGMPNTTKDMSVKQWSSIAASGPVPWHQAPGLFNLEMHQKIPFELDIPSSADKLNARERLCPSLDKKKNEDSSERFINGSLKMGASLLFEKGIKSEEQPNPNLNATQSPFLNTVPVTPYFNLNLNPALTNETSKQTEVCKRHTQQTTPPLAAGKKCCSFSGDDSSCEAQPHNGRLQGDTQGRSHLLPRDWPKINIEEQKPGISYSIVTPLFEKLLTASDVGRIGRLIVPKKCAEVYFPPISNPEGIPLLIQDSEGREWVCQFRFWPNNKSKIYFLEGVHLCMQSMQMQAGDRATFSRLEPGAKLVMGCRKALSSSDKCKLSIVNTNNGGSTHNYAIVKTTEAGEVVSVYNHAQGNQAASGLLAVKKQDLADPTGVLSNADKSSYTATELLGTKPIIRNKRKYSTLASKGKCPQIENKMVELKVTLEQAQVLFRPPNNAPKMMMIEGYEIEEFEEPPIIGRPTILAEDHMGEKIQWAQCEDCFKWRKSPGEVFFPSRWTCSNNLWDPQRSHCSVAQEISSEKLKDLLSVSNEVKKLEVYNEELISLVALEGLDARSYLGIKEEGEAIPPSSLDATKHPRHRPGCLCIVCNHPPSGTGPKHKPTCTRNICLTVKRGLETQVLRSDKKQSENEAETARKKLQHSAQFVDEKIRPCGDAGTSSSSDKMMNNEGHDNDPINMNSHTSPFKGQIDLNIQPEPDKDLSPISDSGGMIKNAVEDAARSHTNMLEKVSNSTGETTSTGIKLHPLKGSFRSSVDQHQLEYPLDSKER